MNYRHLFHAGNFSDVFKHVILIALLQALSRKETPFCVLDTHAGSGLYPLSLLAEQKNKEYLWGVDRLMTATRTDWPLPIQKYVEIVSSHHYPHYYPGSPLITAACLRPQDRAIAMELHPEEYQNLKQLFRNTSQVEVHHGDGYQGIKAFLPPKEKRGLILMDPAFERASDWEKMRDSLVLGLQRFAQGVFAIWYPIKDQDMVTQFKAEIRNLNLEKVLISELWVDPKNTRQKLIGCGMVMVNPPWQIDDILAQCLPVLWESLSVQGAGGYENEWLA